MLDSSRSHELVLGTTDPLLALARRIGLTPFRVIIAMLLITNIPLFVYAWAIDGLKTSNGSGLLDDRITLITCLFGLPSAWAGYLWLPQVISEVVRGLKENKVISGDRAGDSALPSDYFSYDEYVSQLKRMGDSRLVLITALVAALLWQVGFLIPRYVFSGSTTFQHSVVNDQQLEAAVFSLWFLPAYYGVAVTGLRALAFTWWISNLFGRLQIKVWLGHPDRAGGFGPLGSYISKTGWLIGVWGSILLFWVWMRCGQPSTQEIVLLREPVFLLPVSAYLLVIPSALLVPVLRAHWAMAAFRNELLRSISEIMTQETLRFASTDLHSVEDIRTSTEKLESLERVSGLASAYPVWPIKLPEVASYIAQTSVPVFIVAMVERLIEYV